MALNEAVKAMLFETTVHFIHSVTLPNGATSDAIVAAKRYVKGLRREATEVVTAIRLVERRLDCDNKEQDRQMWIVKMWKRKWEGPD